MRSVEEAEEEAEDEDGEEDGDEEEQEEEERRPKKRKYVRRKPRVIVPAPFTEESAWRLYREADSSAALTFLRSVAVIASASNFVSDDSSHARQKATLLLYREKVSPFLDTTSWHQDHAKGHKVM